MISIASLEFRYGFLHDLYTKCFSFEKYISILGLTLEYKAQDSELWHLIYSKILLLILIDDSINYLVLWFIFQIKHFILTLTLTLIVREAYKRWWCNGSIQCCTHWKPVRSNCANQRNTIYEFSISDSSAHSFFKPRVVNSCISIDNTLINVYYYHFILELFSKPYSK